MKYVKFVLLFIVSSAFLFANEHSVQEYFDLLNKAKEEKRWEDLLFYSNVIINDFSDSSLAKDTLFYKGVALYNLSDYEPANQSFSEYLKKQYSSEYFHEALEYKFAIANSYKEGKRKRLLNIQKAPKWSSGRDDALAIYDEIISILPNNEIAAQSLFNKAAIFQYFEEYKEAIDSLQQLIRRFPKHALSPKSYLEIGKVYLKQMNPKHQDFSLVDAAELNLSKFELAFPGDKRHQELVENIHKMTEVYSQGLYEVGYFFEKTKKPNAASIYYSSIVSRFPDTEYGHKAQDGLERIQK